MTLKYTVGSGESTRDKQAKDVVNGARYREPLESTTPIVDDWLITCRSRILGDCMTVCRMPSMSDPLLEWCATRPRLYER